MYNNSRPPFNQQSNFRQQIDNTAPSYGFNQPQVPGWPLTGSNTQQQQPCSSGSNPPNIMGGGYPQTQYQYGSSYGNQQYNDTDNISMQKHNQYNFDGNPQYQTSCSSFSANSGTGINQFQSLSVPPAPPRLSLHIGTDIPLPNAPGPIGNSGLHIPLPREEVSKDKVTQASTPSQSVDILSNDTVDSTGNDSFDSSVIVDTEETCEVDMADIAENSIDRYVRKSLNAGDSLLDDKLSSKNITLNVSQEKILATSLEHLSTKKMTKKLILPCLGKAAAKKRLKAFSSNLSHVKDKAKLVTPIVLDDQDEKEKASPTKKPRKKDKVTSSIEQIVIDEMRIKEALPAIGWKHMISYTGTFPVEKLVNMGKILKSMKEKDENELKEKEARNKDREDINVHGKKSKGSKYKYQTNSEKKNPTNLRKGSRKEKHFANEHNSKNVSSSKSQNSYKKGSCSKKDFVSFKHDIELSNDSQRKPVNRNEEMAKMSDSYEGIKHSRSIEKRLQDFKREVPINNYEIKKEGETSFRTTFANTGKYYYEESQPSGSNEKRFSDYRIGNKVEKNLINMEINEEFQHLRNKERKFKDSMSEIIYENNDVTGNSKKREESDLIIENYEDNLSSTSGVSEKVYENKKQCLDIQYEDQLSPQSANVFKNRSKSPVTGRLEVHRSIFDYFQRNLKSLDICRVDESWKSYKGSMVLYTATKPSISYSINPEEFGQLYSSSNEVKIRSSHDSAELYSNFKLKSNIFSNEEDSNYIPSRYRNWYEENWAMDNKLVCAQDISSSFESEALSDSFQKIEFPSKAARGVVEVTVASKEMKGVVMDIELTSKDGSFTREINQTALDNEYAAFISGLPKKETGPFQESDSANNTGSTSYIKSMNSLKLEVREASIEQLVLMPKKEIETMLSEVKKSGKKVDKKKLKKVLKEIKTVERLNKIAKREEKEKAKADKHRMRKEKREDKIRRRELKKRTEAVTSESFLNTQQYFSNSGEVPVDNQYTPEEELRRNAEFLVDEFSKMENTDLSNITIPTGVPSALYNEYAYMQPMSVQSSSSSDIGSFNNTPNSISKTKTYSPISFKSTYSPTDAKLEAYHSTDSKSIAYSPTDSMSKDNSPPESSSRAYKAITSLSKVYSATTESKALAYSPTDSKAKSCNLSDSKSKIYNPTKSNDEYKSAMDISYPLTDSICPINSQIENNSSPYSPSSPQSSGSETPQTSSSSVPDIPLLPTATSALYLKPQFSSMPIRPMPRKEFQNENVESSGKCLTREEKWFQPVTFKLSANKQAPVKALPGFSEEDYIEKSDSVKVHDVTKLPPLKELQHLVFEKISENNTKPIRDGEALQEVRSEVKKVSDMRNDADNSKREKSSQSPSQRKISPKRSNHSRNPGRSKYYHDRSRSPDKSISQRNKRELSPFKHPNNRKNRNNSNQSRSKSPSKKWKKIRSPPLKRYKDNSSRKRDDISKVGNGTDHARSVNKEPSNHRRSFDKESNNLKNLISINKEVNPNNLNSSPVSSDSLPSDNMKVISSRHIPSPPRSIDTVSHSYSLKQENWEWSVSDTVESDSSVCHSDLFDCNNFVTQKMDSNGRFQLESKPASEEQTYSPEDSSKRLPLNERIQSELGIVSEIKDHDIDNKYWTFENQQPQQSSAASNRVIRVGNVLQVLPQADDLLPIGKAIEVVPSSSSTVEEYPPSDSNRIELPVDIPIPYSKAQTTEVLNENLSDNLMINSKITQVDDTDSSYNSAASTTTTATTTGSPYQYVIGQHNVSSLDIHKSLANLDPEQQAILTAAVNMSNFSHLLSALQPKNILTPTHMEIEPPQPVPPVLPQPVPQPLVASADLMKQRKERKERKRNERERRRLARRERATQKKLEQETREYLSDEEEDALMKEAITEVPEFGSPIPDYEAYVDEDDEDDDEEEVVSKKLKPIPILPPPEKGILIGSSIYGMRNKKCKFVLFADNVRPGDGSPASSDGEGFEVHSTPPLKTGEKSKKKKKMKKTRDIKLYIVGRDVVNSPPPPPIVPPVDGNALKLFPGVTQYTCSSPDTLIIMAHQYHQRTSDEIDAAAVANGALHPELVNGGGPGIVDSGPRPYLASVPYPGFPYPVYAGSTSPLIQSVPVSLTTAESPL